MSTNASATEKLLRVLDFEERQGWRNKAVMNGMQAMAPRWAEQARSEGLDATLVARVEQLMLGYGQRALPDRPETIATLRRVLAGEIEAAEAPPKEKPAPQQLKPQESNRQQGEAQEGRTQAGRVQEGKSQEGKSQDAARPAPQNAPAPAKAQGKAASGGQGSGQKGGGKQVADAASSRPVAADEEGPPEMGGFGSTYVYEYQDPEPPPEPKAPTQGKRSASRIARRPEDLHASVRQLQGVADIMEQYLHRLDIKSPHDLLWHFPARYEDYSQLRKISELVVGEQTTIIANLWEVKERKLGPTRSMIEATFSDGSGTLRATFWSKWVMRQLEPLIGTTLRLSGKVGSFRGYRTLDTPAFEEMDQELVSTGRIAPVYPTTEGLSQKKIRQLVRQVLEEYAQFVEDPLPAELLAEHGLPDIQSAFWQLHFPTSQAEKERALHRFAFEELFYVQLGVLQRRAELKQSTAPALGNGAALLTPFMQGVGFPLTSAQVRVLHEVAVDMEQPVPMTRLVQGDVGSGKTAVAAGAMWIAAANGAQSAMLAPTQILAEQHHRGLARLLEGVRHADGSPLQVALLTGRTSKGERERLLAGLRDGEVDVVVGTTAVIQEGVEFANLGLVVVDEQHRFGVEQRGALRSRAEGQPHLLAMSATPIPRSLALTVFGDLDVSQIDEMPPGRLPVKTVIFRPFERERVYDFLRREAAEGRQAFIVYPLVEESELLEAGAATQEHERLQREVFPELRLALLHGQMKGADKDAIMTAFAAGEFDILVATTVIEVGIDVPNASVIIIEDAERFGLAQLHQLRGRVGRGGQKSFCVLVSRNERDEAEDRLQVLVNTNNGFKLAEEDLKRRGPGEFLGKRQSGLPELQVAQFTDLATVEEARDAARAFFAHDPLLEEHPAVRTQVQRFWRGEGDIS